MKFCDGCKHLQSKFMFRKPLEDLKPIIDNVWFCDNENFDFTVSVLKDPPQRIPLCEHFDLFNSDKILSRSERN